MIEKRTVFILGAGASHPYGFPTAEILRSDIIRDFRRNYGSLIGGPTGRDREWVQAGHPELGVVDGFLTAFDKSSTRSIDLFLSRHPQFERTGKLAIAQRILWAERKSCFRGKVSRPEHDWYSYLYDRLTRELTGRDDYQKFATNEISFITFNYDRSLEHFLFESLLHSFQGANAQEVSKQIESVPIIHVYGRLAPLPWQEEDTAKAFGYGDYGSLSPINLLGMIGNLHAVYEARANPCLDEARRQIQDADRIFFLGFGYADENLDALGIPDGLRAEHDIYGTAMGWTSKEIHDIRSRFAAGVKRDGNIYGHDQVQIRDCDCVSLLREFL